MTVDFDGTIVATDGPRVTYRVDRVRQDDMRAPRHLPEVGRTVVVHYDRTEPELRLDESLRVKGWSYRSEGVSSQIAYDFHGDCGSGAGTTALNGSYLGATPNSDRRPWYLVAAGLLAAGLVAAWLFLATVVTGRDRRRFVGLG